IEECITQSAHLIAEIAGKELTELARQEIKAIIDKEIAHLQVVIKGVLTDLTSGATLATKSLNAKTQSLTKKGYMVTVSICLSSLLVAFGIHYLFPRTTTYQLNDTMARAYFVGERILNNWSKLSDQEKERILGFTIKK